MARGHTQLLKFAVVHNQIMPIDKSRYHQEWDHLAGYIRELFGFHCARCSKDCRVTKSGRDVLQVHHIDENPGNNAEENLIPLCAECHLRIEREARLHTASAESQLELFRESYFEAMQRMRINALARAKLITSAQTFEEQTSNAENLGEIEGVDFGDVGDVGDVGDSLVSKNEVMQSGLPSDSIVVSDWDAEDLDDAEFDQMDLDHDW